MLVGTAARQCATGQGRAATRPGRSLRPAAGSPCPGTTVHTGAGSPSRFVDGSRRPRLPMLEDRVKSRATERPVPRRETRPIHSGAGPRCYRRTVVQRAPRWMTHRAAGGGQQRRRRRRDLSRRGRPVAPPPDAAPAAARWPIDNSGAARRPPAQLVTWPVTGTAGKPTRVSSLRRHALPRATPYHLLMATAASWRPRRADTDIAFLGA